MKLRVQKEEMLEKLSYIQNIVEKRTTMPHLNHFLLKAGRQSCTVMATDIETAIRGPLEAEVEAEGALCIPARKLFEIVKEIDGEVSLKADDLWLKVGAGKSTFRLACIAPEEFPSWPDIGAADETAIEPSLLSEMIEKTLYCAGESDTRYNLNGLLFSLHDGLLTVVGTDGHRMALIEKPIGEAAAEPKKVIVPRKTASEIRKFLDKGGPVVMLLGKNHVLFKIGELEFLARLIEGTYPNYAQVIPAANERKLTADREGFVRALRRVSVMSREKSNAVRVDIEPGGMTLSSSNPDLGEAKDSLEVKYDGPALSVGFNARFLLDVLTAMTSANVLFELQDQLSPTLLKEEGDDSYKCVVMPMRI